MSRAPRALSALVLVSAAILSTSFSLILEPRFLVQRLEVVTAAGHVVWTAPARAGEPFDLAFTHSSERCRWRHHYIIASDRSIRQTGSTFPCFGPGMPTASTDGSPISRTPDGYEVAAPLVLREIRMMNWRPAEVTLLWRGRTWPIGHWLPDYGRFAVRAR
ncbi:MAG: DUF1850 domain-containing protein [Luteitalea sp.]|nr:DUF1850 domain-containing protein [Luteitalea sp.]